MTASLTSEPVVLALHPNNSQLVLGTQAGEAVVMDVLSGEIAFSLPRHATAVTSAAFSPDGNWLATGNADGSVRLWDAFTGSKRLELGRHESAVVFLSFNAASDRVISASQNGVARVSVIRTADILALARQRVKRGFTAQELQDYHIEASAGYQPASLQAAIETPAPRVISLPVIPTRGAAHSAAGEGSRAGDHRCQCRPDGRARIGVYRQWGCQGGFTGWAFYRQPLGPLPDSL